MIRGDKCDLMGECALKNWIIHSFIIGSPVFLSQALGFTVVIFKIWILIDEV